MLRNTDLLAGREHWQLLSTGLPDEGIDSLFASEDECIERMEAKVGIAESAAEAAVSMQYLMSDDVYDLQFQPLEVTFVDSEGSSRHYTHDLLVTFRSGHRRLVFVRNENSPKKSQTTRDIRAIVAATPKDLIVVNANDYTRQRRENSLLPLHSPVVAGAQVVSFTL